MQRSRVLSRGLWAGLACVVGFIALLCLVPPVSRDALVHHLAVPKLYLKAGGMVEIPTMEWAYYPMNLDVLYWASLALGSDILPKFIHFAFGLGTAVLLYRYLRKALGGPWGLAGALLFLTTPVIMKLSTTVYVDLGLAFFSLAATLSLFRCRENGFPGWKGVAWAGVLCGLGLGVKYNGLLVLMILSALVPLMVSRTVPKEAHRDVRAIGLAALFVVAALLAYGPTGIRNTVWTGNPIYPLYNDTVQKVRKALFEPPSKAPVAAVKASASPKEKGPGRMHPLQVRRLIYDESSLDLALLPVRLFFQGQDGNSRLFDGRFSPLLFLFVPLIFLWRRMPDAWRSDVGCLLFISWIYIGLAICLTAVRVRYLVPVVPHLVLLAVYGLKLSMDTLEQAARPMVRRVGLACLALFVVYGLFVNGAYAAYLYRYVNPLPYLAGKVDRDSYVARYRAEHDAFRFVNQALVPTDLLYFIYLGKRGYYCDIPYVPDSGGHLRGLLNRGTALRSADEMADYLKAKGITHLVINMSIVWPHLTEDGRPGEAEGFDRFLKTRTRLLYQSRGVYVFALKP